MAGYLALEGGGTRTTAGFYEGDQLVAEGEAGPSNPMAYGVTATAGVIAELASRLAPAACPGFTVLAGIAGVLNERIAREIAAQLDAVHGLERIVLTTDLHPLLFAHVPESPGVLAIAGTGGSVLVHDGHHNFRRFGGRGPVMGDDGSAYQVAVAALRAVARAEDGIGPETGLRDRLTDALNLENAEALVPWSLTASKQALAGLARTVSACAGEGDACARACITAQATRLSELVRAAADTVSGDGIPLYFQGGLIEHCALFREHFLAALSDCSRLQPAPLRVRGHRAVLALRGVKADAAWVHGRPMAQHSVAATERTSIDMPPIDTLSSDDFVAAMIRHEANVGRALVQQSSALARMTDAVAAAIRRGGRLIYAGAGTSGRLGVLDASECPPTFGTRPDQVIGLMAGGDTALRTGVEGAEDDREQAVRDLAALNPAAEDFVLGIAASGTTPYVLAVLSAARDSGCATGLLCCNPQAGGGRADHVVALPTGPEALPGSTRLNAGTATKVALNIISTGAMAQSGYVYRGHMVRMQPTNKKLRARAIRMVSELAEIPESAASDLLHEAAFDIPVALVMARCGGNAEGARRRLAASNGVLPTAMEMKEVPEL